MGNNGQSRSITVNGSPFLRTFAVAKVLPLDHTSKKSFIVSCSLKRTFASCQKEGIDTLKIRSQHVEELHPTLRPERRERKQLKY